MNTSDYDHNDYGRGIDLLSGRPAAILGTSLHDAEEVIFQAGSDLAQGHLKWWLGASKTTGDGPPPIRPKGVPVLFHERNRNCGVLGWLSLTPRISSGYSDNATLRHCRDVLKHLNPFVGHEIDALDVQIDLRGNTSGNMDGSSASLSVLMDWIYGILGLSPADQSRCDLGRWVSTGGWDIDKKVFSTVDPSVLGLKAKAALEWGYNTLLLIEGQTYSEDFPHQEINKIELPNNPEEALMKILEQDAMTARIEKDVSTLGNLLTTIKNSWIHNPGRRFKEPPKLVNTLYDHAVEDENPTLRVVTASILARNSFQAGGIDGYQYLEEVETYLPHARFTDLRTSEYFRHEWLASKAQALVDLGFWGENATYEKIWKQIEKEADRSQAPDWDVPRHSGIFFANNMISFRDLFQGRLSDEPNTAFRHFHKCLQRRLLYQDLWEPIWKFKKSRRDTYPERQANYLIELWWSIENAGKAGKFSLDRVNELQLQIQSALVKLDQHSQSFIEREPNDFDLVGRWTRSFLTENDTESEKHEELIQNRAENLLNKSTSTLEARSPIRRGLERVYLFGGSKLKASRELLKKIRMRDRIQGPESGLANLLKARTLAILNYHTEDDTLSDELLEWISPQSENVQLTELRKLLTISGTHWGFIEGCPY